MIINKGGGVQRGMIGEQGKLRNYLRLMIVSKSIMSNKSIMSYDKDSIPPAHFDYDDLKFSRKGNEA